jgi:hypothetical protein
VDDDFAVLERWRSGDRRAGEGLCGRSFEEDRRSRAVDERVAMAAMDDAAR